MNARLALKTLPGLLLLLLLAVGVGWWAMRAPGLPGPPPEAAIPVGGAEDADLPVPPAPPRIASDPRYEACLAMVDQDPEGALAMAEKPDDVGGADPASHCRALAEVATGDPEAGAALLDEIGRHEGPSPAARAAILQQAAEAWLMADAPNRAAASAGRALLLTPDSADLLADQAAAEAALGKDDDALENLLRAREAAPDRADILAALGATQRRLGQTEAARASLAASLAIDPDEPTALLERGIIHQQAGALAAARADWQHTIAVAPQSDAADLARQNIELLDAGPEEK